VNRRVSVPLAVLAVAAGAALILLGRSVLGERAALERSDAALAAPVPAEPVARSGGVAGAILRTGDDRAARAAAADYQQARAQIALAPAVRGRALAQQELEPLAASGPAARRSWAATLLAVLESEAAQLDRSTAKRHVAAALGALRTAVAADPANEDAKRDLELLLSLQSQGRSQQQGQGKKGTQRQQSKQPGNRGKKAGRAGASASPGGSGW